MTEEPDLKWLPITRTARPWTRWWWLGSAVDAADISRLLTEYRLAGLGGVEITPIYGVQGADDREIPYLSPEWIAMLHHTLAEADRLDLGVDMVTGTGWPFGGPWVSGEDALDKLTITKTENEGVSVYEASLTWAGRMVKRPAPGGEGKCINPFSRKSLDRYLARFDDILHDLPVGALRCHFHDSFEYLADASPELFSEFERRRGYDLRSELAALAGDGHADRVARVKTDYRETLAELLLENFTEPWTAWGNGQGSRSRNQAHGSPGNLLDLYGAADIPETETFGGPCNPIVAKFASSPAHVLGKPLVSSETATWLDEHFTVTLGQIKSAVDGLFLAGINHIFYHGTAYSPADAAWPGWLFYASTTIAPQDPLWHDLGALNAYIARCQSLLQLGEPDNDILLYWPLHDLWQNHPDIYMLEIGGCWLEGTTFALTAQRLWDAGFGFDYVSDRQLQSITTGTILTPPCDFMPVDTLRRLVDLAKAGATVIFQDKLPTDVPGLHDLEDRRQHFQALLAECEGLVHVAGDIETALLDAGARRESIATGTGVRCIRRRLPEGHCYFLVNEGDDAYDGWMHPSSTFTTALLQDPMTGESGIANVRGGPSSQNEIRLGIEPGASLFVRTYGHVVSGARWRYFEPAGEPVAFGGRWDVEFIYGGPELPPALSLDRLTSWTEFGDVYERFSGTARYQIAFDRPATNTDTWLLDLGRVADSAQITLNGELIGTVFAEPYTIRLSSVRPEGNILEIAVTNVAANRIRDLDRRGVPWRIFKDINFVDRHYKAFDASQWPVRTAGLLGPVRLIPLRDRSA
jgi:hypothetical protein